MKKTTRILTAIVLAAVMCLCVTACTPKQTQTTAKGGFVSININPAIELITDQNGTVISVRAANGDAQILLSDMNLIGKSIADASADIAAAAQAAGYLTDTNAKVRVLAAGETEGAADSIAADVEQGVKSESDIAEVEQSKSLEREVKKLKEQDPVLYAEMTAAKLKLIYAVMYFDTAMTVETGAKLSVKALTEMLKEYYDDYSDFVTDELEDKFDALYESEAEAIQQQIDMIYGEEYAIAAKKVRDLEKLADEFENRLENAAVAQEDIDALVELFGLTDSAAMQDGEGKVTVNSVENYIDVLEDEWDKAGEDDDDYEGILDTAEDILEKYDEDNMTLETDMVEQLREIIDAEILNLEDLEDYIDNLEDEVDEMQDQIELTEQQKEDIKTLKAQKKQIKQQIKEQLKSEIEAAKAELKAIKAQRVSGK